MASRSPSSIPFVHESSEDSGEETGDGEAEINVRRPANNPGIALLGLEYADSDEEDGEGGGGGGAPNPGPIMTGFRALSAEEKAVKQHDQYEVRKSKHQAEWLKTYGACVAGHQQLAGCALRKVHHIAHQAQRQARHHRVRLDQRQ